MEIKVAQGIRLNLKILNDLQNIIKAVGNGYEFIQKHGQYQLMQGKTNVYEGEWESKEHHYKIRLNLSWKLLTILEVENHKKNKKN